MSVRRDAYTTKDLTVRTWPDFVSLFSKGNGWDFCWCMHFQRPRTLPKGQRRRTRAERGVRNRRQKKELVEHGLAHGILVYAKGEPVGWFGNASTHGTLSMFERQGFKVVGPNGLSNVVVRRTVVGSKGRGTKVRSDNGQAGAPSNGWRIGLSEQCACL